MVIKAQRWFVSLCELATVNKSHNQAGNMLALRVIHTLQEPIILTSSCSQGCDKKMASIFFSPWFESSHSVFSTHIPHIFPCGVPRTIV